VRCFSTNLIIGDVITSSALEPATRGCRAACGATSRWRRAPATAVEVGDVSLESAGRLGAVPTHRTLVDIVTTVHVLVEQRFGLTCNERNARRDSKMAVPVIRTAFWTRRRASGERVSVVTWYRNSFRDGMIYEVGFGDEIVYLWCIQSVLATIYIYIYIVCGNVERAVLLLHPLSSFALKVIRPRTTRSTWMQQMTNSVYIYSTRNSTRSQQNCDVLDVRLPY